MHADERFVALESQVRTLKRMLFGVFGVVVVGGLLAATSLQSVPDVVRAKKFEVVGGKGDVVTILDAKLMMHSPGSMVGVVNGAFVVVNEDGAELLQLQANEHQTAGELVLMTEKGTQFVTMGHEAEQGIIRTTNDNNKLVSTLPSLNHRLIDACEQRPGDPAKVKYLIDNGAWVNVEAGDAVSGQMTPLQVAIMSDSRSTNTSVIALLLKRGANPNKMLTLSVPKQGKPNLKMQASPLMWVVATSGDPTAVTLLLEAGADVNARGANLSIKPWTPLMALAQSPFGSPDVVSMLLKAGANANVKTSDGKTALDFARDNPAFKGTKVFQELEAAMKQK